MTPPSEVLTPLLGGFRRTQHRHVGALTQARASTVVFLAVLGSLMFPGSAQAHTDLVSSEPATGATRGVPPTRIQLTFSEALDEEFANVTVAVGTRKAVRLQPKVRGSMVTVLPDVNGTTTGRSLNRWRVAYRVVSADGHPVTGTITFAVAGPARGQDLPAARPSSTPTGTAGTEPGVGFDEARGSEDGVEVGQAMSEPGASTWVPSVIIGLAAVATWAVVMVRVARGRRRDQGR